MPWWIWLLLVLFMIAMLVIGVTYVVMHALAALRSVGQTGARCGERFAALDHQDEAEPPVDPSFTMPLQHTCERYVQAHAEVIARRQRKRDRHVQLWSAWRHKDW